MIMLYRSKSSRGFSVFPSNPSNTMKTKFIINIAVIILFLVSFSHGFAFAQEDTLILMGINTDLGQARGVSAYNGCAFVADWDSGVLVINYAIPTLPTLLTQYTEHEAFDIEIEKDLAYYVSYGALYIRDIGNPLESEIVGWCSGWWWDHMGFRVHLFDTLALVLHRTSIEYCILKIIDISDPTNPQVLSSSYPQPWGTIYFGDAYKKDNYVYWVDRAYSSETGEELGRIIVYDITDPNQPIPIVVDTCLPSKPYAIWIKDNYAYVGEGYGGRGLVVFDISDPYQIDSVGCFPIPEGRVWNVYLKGRYAYVCAHLRPTLPSDRIYVLDISAPTNPSLVAYYNTPGCPRDVFVDEPYVLVAEDTSLLIFKASFLYLPGDVDGDIKVDVGDVVFLINYLYKQGSPPEPLEVADVNGDCLINVGDVLYLINYLFKNGPAPLDGCSG